MTCLKWRIVLGVTASLFCFVGLGNGADDVGVDSLSNRTYIHKEAKVALKVPDDWHVIAPYRLRKSTTSTVLGLERNDPRVVITVIWSPLGNRPFSDIIRTADELDDLGDEYATLIAVYGKGKVGRPTSYKSNAFSIYKILVDDGPEKEGRNAGALYLFETGSGENKWKVKIRAVYPQLNREEYIKQVEDVIAQFVTEG